MEKFKQLAKIREIYAKGENIIKYLKSIDDSEKNSIEDILISYDFQAGSYIEGLSAKPEFKDNYCTALARIIDQLGEVNSIIEVGVGEATTLGNVVRKLKHTPEEILGFDISWSRLKFAKDFLAELGLNQVRLFTANLFEIPLLDNSVDFVYTSHSIEPNGGKEENALKELYRITGKYLVLLEPAFELADEKSRARMKEHGYVTNLLGAARDLGYNVIEHRLFDYSANPLNPTGVIVIKKESTTLNESVLRCPISLTELSNQGDCLLYSKESFLAYPVVKEIPCLLKENSILATHLLTDYDDFKSENGISIR